LLCPASPAPALAGGKGTAQDKIKALEAAGVTVTNSPAQMGATMKRIMQERGLA
jgi:succinyl-CoA synthetase alpha subunit